MNKVRWVVLVALVGICFGGALARTQKKPLYERLGGVYGIAAVVDEFVDILLSDEVIGKNEKVVKALDNPNLNLVPGLKFHITAQICEATGGPQRYTGRSMEDSHKHLDITEEEFAAAAADLKKAMDKLKVPEAEQNELLEIVASTKEDIVKRK
ncbi:MAG: group 1 truncated hemoglobin [Candidatus Eremiobacterota bacterium]